MTVSTSNPATASQPAIQNYHSHKHVNQPVVYPYKPPVKPDPPGAHLYKQAWAITKIATEAMIFLREPETYTLGLILGALEGGRKWNENGPPKQLDSDSEMKDFGATAHTSTIWSLFTIFAMNAIGIGVPLCVDTWFPQETTVSKINPSLIETLSEEEKFFFAERLGTTHRLPSSGPQWFKHGFVLYHAVMAGEELVNRFARWFDVGDKKK